ncbi:MAG: hypothetical protein GY768_27275 [Planctomycetaceae bacterium]|nr:hypothetical protein [Planctomycetaceae bacterium]
MPRPINTSNPFAALTTTIIIDMAANDSITSPAIIIANTIRAVTIPTNTPTIAM